MGNKGLIITVESKIKGEELEVESIIKEDESYVDLEVESPKKKHTLN